VPEVPLVLELHLLLGSVTGNFGNLPDYGVDLCAGRVKSGPGPLFFYNPFTNLKTRITDE
jgi:hypothetical protein